MVTQGSSMREHVKWFEAGPLRNMMTAGKLPNDKHACTGELQLPPDQCATCVATVQ